MQNTCIFSVDVFCGDDVQGENTCHSADQKEEEISY